MIKNTLWRDKKRLWCRLPWTFTEYGLSENRLFVDTGFLTKTYKDVRLYRVLDVGLTQSFIQRIFGLGSIHIKSNDADLRTFVLKNIPNSHDVKELISEQVEKERLRNRVSSREWMDADDDDNFDDDDR